jgi:hypothetical protein
MSLDDTRPLRAIAAMFLELLARQMALVELLRSQPGVDEKRVYRKAHPHARFPHVGS